MKKTWERIVRASTVLLAAAMLFVAVIKAQGCRSTKDDDAMLPPTKAGPFIEGEPHATGATFQDDPVEGTLMKPAVDGGLGEAVDAGQDAGHDAGHDAGPFGNMLKGEDKAMIPASKSGGFIDRPGFGLGIKGEEKPQPQQQNAAPK